MMNRYIFILIVSVLFVPLSLFAEDKDGEKTLTNISAAENSVIAKFSIGDSITFNTSFDSICGGFRERVIESGTKNIMYESFNSVKNENGEWVLKFYEDVVLEKGHTYTLEIEGHEVADMKSKATGKVSVIYIGDGEKIEPGEDTYEYSNIKYLLTEDTVELKSLRLDFVTVIFDGDVRFDTERSKIIDEDGKEYSFPNIMPIEKYDYYWQFYIPLELMAQSTSHLTLRIYTTDLAGRAVKGNRGKGENSYYELYCKCEFGFPVLSVSPEEGRFKSLENFTFSNAQGIEVRHGENEIRLLSSNGEIIASFLASEYETGADNLSFTYSLEEVLDSVGHYTLVVPDSTFSIGTKMVGNKMTSVAYEISDKWPYVESIDPDDGSEVESLSKIIITFNDIALPVYDNQHNITVTNASDSIITFAKATIDENREDVNQCMIVLDRPIVEPGEYHLNISAAVFRIGQSGDNTSKEMIFKYTVFGPPDPVYDYYTNAKVDDKNKLERLEIVFPSFAYVELVDGRTIQYRYVEIKDSMNNETIAIGKLRGGSHQNELYVDSLQYIDSLKADLGDKLIEGKYWLHVPANTIIFGNEIYDKELELEINFDLVYVVDVSIGEDDNQKLEKVDIIFKAFKVVDLTDSDNGVYHDVTITDKENKVIATAQLGKGLYLNNHLFIDNIFTTDDLKDELGDKLGEGKYLLHVPAGTLVLDGEPYNKEFVLAFGFVPQIIDGQFANTAQANSRVRVYNAQGMLSRDVKDPETALRGLHRGMYIINGKKILIK